MAATYKPPFVQTTNFVPVKFSTANTTTTGTAGTFSSAYVTGGTDGTRVSRIVFRATGTVTAGRIIVWYDDGSVKYPVGTLLVTAAIPSATVLPYEGQVVFPEPLIIASGKTLLATTYNGEEFAAIPFAANY